MCTCSCCIWACAHLGCAVPQAVHRHSGSVMSVGHVDDRLSDGLDHLLLESQQARRNNYYSIFSSNEAAIFSFCSLIHGNFKKRLTVLCFSGAHWKKSRKTLWTRECLITCSLKYKKTVQVINKHPDKIKYKQNFKNRATAVNGISTLDSLFILPFDPYSNPGIQLHFLFDSFAADFS